MIYSKQIDHKPSSFEAELSPLFRVENLQWDQKDIKE